MSATFDPTAPLTPSGNLRRRLAVSTTIVSGATLAAGVAVAVLALVVYDVASRGAGVISWSFLTTNTTSGVQTGIEAALIGTGLIVACGALIAVPLGILTAIYLSEFARPGSRIAALVKLSLDLMQGLPTVIVGLFVLGLLVLPEHHDSGFAGSVALSIIMLPLIARTGQEVLRAVPGTLRDAADALGVNRWRAILGVILPAAASGIATAAILAIARAAGETAPLLICDDIFDPSHTTIQIFGHGVPNIPVTILTLSEQPTPQGLARAWGAALVLLAVILIANISARLLLARSKARRT